MQSHKVWLKKLKEQADSGQKTFDFDGLFTPVPAPEPELEPELELKLTAANTCGTCKSRGHFWSAWHELSFCSDECYESYVSLHGDGGTAQKEAA